MALVGTGYRTVSDFLIEVSQNLVEPYAQTTLSAPVSAGNQAVAVASTASMYAGTSLVVDSGSSAKEVITLSAVAGNTITATFANAHATGATVVGATFPTQQPTDPLYTQAEMLGYASRAQNEFLSKVPVIYALFYQQANFGQIFQPTPLTTIEIQRIASSSVYIAVASATRAGDTVTIETADPHGLTAGSTPYFTGAEDVSFTGNFQILTVPSPTSFTYFQDAADASTTGGQLLYWLRLYEYTQEELTQQFRQWQNAYIGSPSAWFEDRAGLYQFGLNGKPASNFPLELLCSIRDTDALGLGDAFLVPDVMLHIVRYKMLEYIFQKDGVASDPQRAAYCKERFDKGVIAAQRWIGGIAQGLKK